MSLYRSYLLKAPQANRSVVGGAGEEQAILARRNGRDTVGMPYEGLDEQLRGYVVHEDLTGRQIVSCY